MALIVQQKALQTVGSMQPLVALIHKRDRALADQLRRAASSIVLNIAEADGSIGGNKTLRFSTACGSAKETRATLQLAAAWGYIPHAKVAMLDSELDEICAMTWRLSGR